MISWNISRTLQMLRCVGERDRSYAKHRYRVFKHKHITNPMVTPADEIINAAKDLTAALRGDVPGPLGAT